MFDTMRLLEKNKTVIFISHGLENIKHADKIFVMKKLLKQEHMKS